MIEAKRKMEEEKRAYENAQKKAEKLQQEAILNRRGNSRPRLTFELKNKVT